MNQETPTVRFSLMEFTIAMVVVSAELFYSLASVPTFVPFFTFIYFQIPFATVCLVRYFVTVPNFWILVCILIGIALNGITVQIFPRVDGPRFHGVNYGHAIFGLIWPIMEIAAVGFAMMSWRRGSEPISPAVENSESLAETSDSKSPKPFAQRRGV